MTLIITFIILFNLTLKNVQAQYDSVITNLNNNVLIIIVDDLRHLTDKSVKLNNIQKIAANGVNFENAFAQQALCAPSRNSMLTGRRPDSLHLYDFYSYWRDTVGNFTTLPQLFKDNGYDTYSVGKVFHPGESSNFTDDFPYSWSEVPYHPSTEKYKDAAVCRDTITRELQRNLICPVNISQQPEQTLPDLQSLNFAVNILQQRKHMNRPFFLSVGFHKPHIPLKFPEEYLDRVSLHKLHPPRHPYIPSKLPPVAWQPWTDIRKRDDIARLNITFPFGTMPHAWTMNIIQGYYAAAMYVDDLIGELVRHVDLKNTVVVLTGDHGWSLGENGLWAKYSNFDVALRVPLIFHIPGTKPNNIKTPVELLDIFPTLTEIVLGKSIPKCGKNNQKLCCEGKSLVDLMGSSENDVTEEKFSISQYPRPGVYPTRHSDKPKLKDIKIMGYSIRSKHYRYTEWVSFNNTVFTMDWYKNYGLELYDHDTDPFEARNVAYNREYRQINKYLSKLLREAVDTKERVN